MSEEAHCPKEENNLIIHQGRRWEVYYTKPRREKILERSCKYHAIIYYLPLRRSAHSRGRKERVFSIPLFPGYFFACVDKSEKLKILKTNCIVKGLEVVDENELLSDLNNIDHALSCCDSLQPCNFLQKGKKVRIVRGPYKGLEGTIQEIKNKRKLILSVNFIRKSVALEIDPIYIDIPL